MLTNRLQQGSVRWRCIKTLWFAFICVWYLFCASVTTQLFAFERSDVPLKNWGGFAVHRSWVYDALEKVVLAGLADQALLNTRPISRVEAARIIGQAVRRLKIDQYGDYNHRGYLEEMLYQLVEEFGSELAEMGIRTPHNRNSTIEFVDITPVDHAQFQLGFASRSGNSVASFGQKFDKGTNSTSTVDGRGKIDDFFSFYYQSEFSSIGNSYQGRLRSGYGKFKLWDAELLVGRESLWWGPGFRGSMSFSSNAFPLDQVKLSSAEPFHLPWLLKYLGPMKAAVFAAQLEDNRDISRAKVAGWRINMAPSRYFEFGFSRLFMFGGKSRDTVTPGDFFQLLFSQGSDVQDSARNVNNVMSFDGTLRIPDVKRYILFARDAAFYFDFGWDDTKFGLLMPDRPGGIVGTYLTGLFGDSKMDLRLEYAQTSEIQFNHNIYTSGFNNRGSPLSHFIGTDGSEMFARISRWINPDFLFGLQLSNAEIGPTAIRLSGSPREKRNSFAMDVSYRVSGDSSIFMTLDFANVEDRGFVSRQSATDSSFKIEFTRSFDW